jgi:fucose 4-O-acetylase-like acetyltransferase
VSAGEPAPSATRTGRLPWLDVLKGVAIALVLFNHAVLWPTRASGGVAAFLYGMPFGTVGAFCAVAGYLAGRRPVGAPSRLKRRALQLLVPWAVWAPVYAAGPLLWSVVGGAGLPMGFEPAPWAAAVLLGGGALWFLPVLFAVTATASALDSEGARWTPFLVSVGLYACIAVASSASGLSPLALGRGTFWPLAPIYVASFWLGLRLARDDRRRVAAPMLVLIVVLTMVGAGACTWARVHDGGVAWSWAAYAVGAVGGWAALPLAVRGTRPLGAFARLLAAAGEASLGVYVLHPALLGSLMAMVPAWRTVPGAAVLSVAVLAASSAIVLGVRRRWPRIASRVL